MQLIDTSKYTNKSYTFIYGTTYLFDEMGVIDFMQCFIDDMDSILTADVLSDGDTTYITSKLRNLKWNLYNCISDCDLIHVSGTSNTLHHMEISITIRKNSNYIEFDVGPSSLMERYFDNFGEHLFDTYMDSIEIKAQNRANTRKIVSLYNNLFTQNTKKNCNAIFDVCEHTGTEPLLTCN